MLETVTYGRSNINFFVNRRDRKTLGINVYPTGKITVDAPHQAPIEAIKTKVKKRGAWILKQTKWFKELPKTQPGYKYISGESFKYLGRQYRLFVEKSNAQSIKLKGGRLAVSVNNAGATDVRKLIDRWYLEKGVKVFNELLADSIKLFSKSGLKKVPIIKIRYMKTRWGSCTKDGVILLNPLLVKAPKDCIQYVIIHELCHLKEHNHDKAFYKLLNKVLPDWEKLKAKLNHNVEIREL